MNAGMKKPTSGARWRFAGAVVIIVASFSLGGASIALGAAPSISQGTSAASNQYVHPKPKPKPPTTVVAGASSSSGSSPANAGATLPFTGVSLIWPAIAAIVLVSLGLGLRRHERKNS